MNIEYYTDRHYGIERHYIADESIAKSVRLLTGRLSLSLLDIEALTVLGFTLIEVLKPKNK